MHQQLVEGFLRENREVHKYTYQLFLSHMCEIFMLSWPGFPKVSIPATSEGFQQFSKKFPKMFQRSLSTSEATNKRWQF